MSEIAACSCDILCLDMFLGVKVFRVCPIVLGEAEIVKLFYFEIIKIRAAAAHGLYLYLKGLLYTY